MKIINNFKIGQRLLIVFLMITVLGLFYVTNNIFNLMKLEEGIEDIYTIRFLSIDYLIEADRDAYQSSIAISQSLSNHIKIKPDKLKSKVETIEENIIQVETRYNKFADIFDITKKVEYVKNDSLFWRNYNQLKITTDTIVTLLEKGDFIKAEDIYYGRYMSSFIPMQAALDQFTNIHLQSSELKYNETVEINHNIRFYTIIIFFVVLLLIFLSGFILIRSITKPLLEVVKVANEVANGNLTVNINVSGKDETSQMLFSIQQMLIKIREMISQIRSGSESILNSSSQISIAASQIASGSSQQAASTEEVSSSIEEMVANIDQNSDNAQETEKIALQAYQNMSIVSKAVEQTLNAMKLITEKTSIVNEISEKTDLLAINAAIEASRAGESGEGFAVVASEVRALAIQSKTAASQINEVSIKSVGIAENSKKLIAKVIPNIEKTAKLIQEIAAASMEQNSGATQINDATQQLANVTQENSAISEQFASNAEELAGMAEQLIDSISFFKTTQEELDAFSDEMLKQQIMEMTNILNSRIKSKSTHIIKDKTNFQEPTEKGTTIKLDEGKESPDNNFEKF